MEPRGLKASAAKEKGDWRFYHFSSVGYCKKGTTVLLVLASRCNHLQALFFVFFFLRNMDQQALFKIIAQGFEGTGAEWLHGHVFGLQCMGS